MEHQLTILIEKWLDGSLQPEQRRELAALLRNRAHSKYVERIVDQELFQGLYAIVPDLETSGKISQHLMEAIRDKDMPISRVQPALRVAFLRRRWFRYAAAIILIASTITAVVVSSDRKHGLSKKDVHSIPHDITPGGERAVLTLADGSQIVLDSAGNGTLAQQGNAQVVKLSDGQISYNLKGAAREEIIMNTMTTPKGGQYQLTLPDGSRVWLNAASSITFPATFVGGNRSVTVTGEVYFEVVKNKAQPFVVNINNESLVQVLGTSFNVNSYRDGSAVTTTTLLEGSIKISQQATAGRSVTLRPGQQAVSSSAAQSLQIRDNADIAKVMAWRNGLFNFDGMGLPEMMRQFERWYDVTVIYEGAIPEKVFRGKMQRDLNLSEALEILKGVGIHYRIEQDRKVIITP